MPSPGNAKASSERAVPAGGNLRPLWSVSPPALLSRLTGPLDSLIARGVARHERGNLIALHLRPEEAAQGGTATISMPVDIHCPDCMGHADRLLPGCPRCNDHRTLRELFTAWLTIPRNVTDGAILAASVELPDALAVVRFRVLIDSPT
jgi:hypothetical protein